MKYDTTIFRNNFTKGMNDFYGVEAVEARYVITPVFDPTKYETGEDSAFRLIILSEENIGGKKIGFEDAMDILCSFAPLFPTKVEIGRLPSESGLIFELKCSTRIRKPSAIANIESEYAPFVFPKV